MVTTSDAARVAAEKGLSSMPRAREVLSLPAAPRPLVPAETAAEPRPISVAFASLPKPENAAVAALAAALFDACEEMQMNEEWRKGLAISD
ncbi:MAG: hypothetical protein ABSE69_05940 [Roseiarcus sp.]